MMNSYELEDCAYRINTKGFSYLRSALPPALVSDVRRELDEAIHLDSQHISDYEHYRFRDIVHFLFGRGDSFGRVIENEAINQVVDYCLSPQAIIHSYNAIKLAPGRGTNASKVHRDCPRFYHQDQRLMLQALVMIDDFTADNGATRLLPSSHHSDSRPSEEFFEENSEVAIGKAGDVVFFDSLVWHAGGFNNTECARRGLTIVFSRSYMKQQIDICQALPDSEIDSFNPMIKQRIGFDVRVPRSIDEFLLPEDKRMYKSNQG